MIHERQQLEGWGKRFIPRLAADLKNELSDAKGFSDRNLRAMVFFYTEYQSLKIGKRPVAELENENNLISPIALSELETEEIPIWQRAVAKLQSNEIQLINPKKYFGIDLGYTLV